MKLGFDPTYFWQVGGVFIKLEALWIADRLTISFALEPWEFRPFFKEVFVGTLQIFNLALQDLTISFVLVSCFNMVPDGPCQSLNLLGRSPCNPKGTQGTEFFFVKRNVYGKIQNGRFRLDHFTFVAALDESKLQPFQAFRQAVKPSVGRGSLYFIRYLRQPAGFDVVHKLK